MTCVLQYLCAFAYTVSLQEPLHFCISSSYACQALHVGKVEGAVQVQTPFIKGHRPSLRVHDQLCVVHCILIVLASFLEQQQSILTGQKPNAAHGLTQIRSANPDGTVDS